jgi:release factor glutamine methyltransferase
MRDDGPDERAVTDRICNEAASHLEINGSLWMTHSSVADTKRSRELLAAAGLTVTEVAERFEPGERLVVLKATREF